MQQKEYKNKTRKNIGKENVEEEEQFRYLGSQITKNGKSPQDI